LIARKNVGVTAVDRARARVAATSDKSLASFRIPAAARRTVTVFAGQRVRCLATRNPQ
jgi:hypothetical protein